MDKFVITTILELIQMYASIISPLICLNLIINGNIYKIMMKNM